MDTPGSFQDRVKVLARAVFESASSKPLFWRFIHSVIWAPPGTALPQTESCTQFYDGVVGVLAAAAEKAVARGEIAPGPTGARMLILMGCDQRGGDRLRHRRQARVDPRTGRRHRRNNFQRMAMTRNRYENVLAFLVSALLFSGVASAQPLSRADAVAQALDGEPHDEAELRTGALLEGRIVEAKADALPDITWNTFAGRSRDPALLNSPDSTRFRRSFARRCAPIPANAFSTSADIRQTIFSFKLGKALEAARVARVRGRSGSAAGTTSDVARRDTGVQPAVVRDRAAPRHSREPAVEADPRRLRPQPARRRCGDRARSASRRSRCRERARRSPARRKRCLWRALRC